MVTDKGAFGRWKEEGRGAKEAGGGGVLGREGCKLKGDENQRKKIF